MGSIIRIGRAAPTVTGWKWIKISGARQYHSVNLYYINVYEIEVKDNLGGNQHPGSTAWAQDYYSSESPSNMIDGSTATRWLSKTSEPSATSVWCALYKAGGMAAKTLRLNVATSYAHLGFRNATVYGSNDSTDAVNGSWTTLATGINMHPTGGWTDHTLS